jgi:hypothetical protein
LRLHLQLKLHVPIPTSVVDVISSEVAAAAAVVAGAAAGILPAVVVSAAIRAAADLVAAAVISAADDLSATVVDLFSLKNQIGPYPPRYIVLLELQDVIRKRGRVPSGRARGCV